MFYNSTNTVYVPTKKDLIKFVGLLAILVCTYPFVFQAFLPLPSISLLVPITIGIYFVFVKKKTKILNHPITKIACFQILGTILTFVYSMDMEYIKQFLYIIWGICFLSLINELGVYKFLFLFNRLILILGILGTLSFFLSVFLGNNVLFEFVGGDDRTSGLTYFTFSNSIYEGFIRYAGVFDEPGAMAFWGMFSLITNKVFINDKKIEIPLIICLAFTFSLAYFIQLFIYFLFFYVLNEFSFKRFVLVIILILGVITYLFTLDTSSFIYQATLGRLGIGNSIDFVSDNNRVSYMEKSYALFKRSPVFGVGPSVILEKEAIDNPYETLARDGVIGAFFIYLPLIASVFYSKLNRSIIIAAFILFVGYLQRPFHFQFMHYTMLYLFFFIACTKNIKYQRCHLTK